MMSIRDLFSRSPDRKERNVPAVDRDRLNGMIGMTWITEREWWFDYASNRFTGRGAMVDLGCWFGSTTASLAEGLSRNADKKAASTRIYAFDRFTWDDWMEFSVRNTPYEGRFRQGDDFQEVFMELTEPYRDNIECVKADLTEYRWEKGDIEFLLVDAMKSWPLCNNILRSFYTHLVPGMSTVLHQDFCHYYPYWIHLCQYRYRDFFKPLPDTIKCNSIAFDYVKKIPDEELTRNLSIEDFTESEIEDAYRYSASIVAPVNTPHIEAAHVMAVHAKQGKEAATRMFQSLAGRWPGHPVLDMVKNMIGLGATL
jgi:hypothetical protein